MAVYRVEHVDHGNTVFSTEYVEHDDEDALIEELRIVRNHNIGAGFDVWDGESPRLSAPQISCYIQTDPLPLRACA